jgi:hypothetical protein
MLLQPQQLPRQVPLSNAAAPHRLWGLELTLWKQTRSFWRVSSRRLCRGHRSRRQRSAGRQCYSLAAV